MKPWFNQYVRVLQHFAQSWPAEYNVLSSYTLADGDYYTLDLRKEHLTHSESLSLRPHPLLQPSLFACKTAAQHQLQLAHATLSELLPNRHHDNIISDRNPIAKQLTERIVSYFLTRREQHFVANSYLELCKWIYKDEALSHLHHKTMQLFHTQINQSYHALETLRNIIREQLKKQDNIDTGLVCHSGASSDVKPKKYDHIEHRYALTVAPRHNISVASRIDLDAKTARADTQKIWFNIKQAINDLKNLQKPLPHNEQVYTLQLLLNCYLEEAGKTPASTLVDTLIMAEEQNEKARALYNEMVLYFEKMQFNLLKSNDQTLIERFEQYRARFPGGRLLVPAVDDISFFC